MTHGLTTRRARAMRHRSRAAIATATMVVAGAAIGASIAFPRVAAQEQATGQPDGAEILRVRCLACHETDLITSQRLSRSGWDAELTKMVRWGAALPDTERGRLLDHLVARFGVQPASPTAADNAAPGQRLYERGCRACHGDDLVAQQRLTVEAWRREVEKMVAWGAVVPPEDQPALAAYLTARYGPTATRPR